MHRALVLIIGILLGLVWKRRTGWGCGGIITPAVLALYDSPERIIICLLAGIILAPIVEILADYFDLYGTEKTGAAMILGVIVSEIVPSNFGLGFVLPGLIACEINRQGIIMTICGTVSCALAAIMIAGCVS